MAANGYVLTLSLLVAAYVRHLEDDDYEAQNADSSILSADRSLLERKTIARTSVSALAQFLLSEITRPHDAIHATNGDADPTGLDALFQRLQRALRARPEDTTVLVDEVLHVLASVDSPSALHRLRAQPPVTLWSRRPTPRTRCLCARAYLVSLFGGSSWR
jgi:hypothetical protein